MIDPKFIVRLQGKDYVLLIGLLDHAHKNGLRSIETDLVQIPGPDNQNVAIVRAMVRWKSEGEDACWSAYGDASPANTRGPIQTALIRMAETRSIARALRFAGNVAATAVEELGESDDAPHANGKAAVAAPGRTSVVSDSVRPAESAEKQGTAARHAPTCTWPGCEHVLTANQITMSQHHCKRNLCPSHMREAEVAKAA